MRWQFDVILTGRRNNLVSSNETVTFTTATGNHVVLHRSNHWNWTKSSLSFDWMLSDENSLETSFLSFSSQRIPKISVQFCDDFRELLKGSLILWCGLRAKYFTLIWIYIYIWKASSLMSLEYTQWRWVIDRQSILDGRLFWTSFLIGQRNENIISKRNPSWTLSVKRETFRRWNS